MADATAFVGQEGIDQTATLDTQPHRPARPNELKLVRERLVEVIFTSEFYSDEFKAYEADRLTLGFLRNLMAIDPRHVLILLEGGAPVGIQITGPETGTLWLYWSYVFPETRKNTNSMRFMPALIKAWDNDRFHKVSTYIRPCNRVAIAFARRAKFKHVVTLENHIFGDDFMLFERPLAKALANYDHGLNLNFAQRLGNRLLATVGL